MPLPALVISTGGTSVACPKSHRSMVMLWSRNWRVRHAQPRQATRNPGTAPLTDKRVPLSGRAHKAKGGTRPGGASPLSTTCGRSIGSRRKRTSDFTRGNTLKDCPRPIRRWESWPGLRNAIGRAQERYCTEPSDSIRTARRCCHSGLANSCDHAPIQFTTRQSPDDRLTSLSGSRPSSCRDCSRSRTPRPDFH